MFAVYATIHRIILVCSIWSLGYTLHLQIHRAIYLLVNIYRFSILGFNSMTIIRSLCQPTHVYWAHNVSVCILKCIIFCLVQQIWIQYRIHRLIVHNSIIKSMAELNKHNSCSLSRTNNHWLTISCCTVP